MAAGTDTDAPVGDHRRERVRVRGIVQGVGFRPFVYRLACRQGLVGHVLNDAGGVEIEVQGPTRAIEAFACALVAEIPPLAVVHDVVRTPLPLGPEEDGFRIVVSRAGAGRATLVSPDVATCDDCLRELFDPADRRYRYAFLNCTNCGPRYTIIEDVPYDRPLTTMRGFTMCADCRAEYDDPGDRRFHAQPVACPACGPQLALFAPDGTRLATDDPVSAAADRLARGAIGAVKGLGGYHLACDASSEAAVTTLRLRKGRDEKPFAVMARALTDVRRFAAVTPAEALLLARRERPIVLLPKRVPFPLADAVAPRNGWVGAMLPYTPLHHLLFAAVQGPLVMTSGNRSDEPIVCDDGEAFRTLAPLVDFFLVHDRPILVRADDSVMRVVAGVPRHLRRSRGFAPAPVLLPRGGPSVLAVGGELKNTLCITRGREAFASPHLGDLQGVANLDFFAATEAHFRRILDVRPELVVHDLHPDYASTRWASERSGLPTFAVQHHHAHVLACLAENGHDGPAVGLALDGTGYGLDGTIWGGEVLLVDGLAMQRTAHLRPLPLAGGDRAAQEPWRMALAALHEVFGPHPDLDGLAFAARVEPQRLAGVTALLAGPLGAALPRSSGLGRLFDAVAALVGLREVARYEGQAPLELEAASATGVDHPYRFEVVSAPNGVEILDFAPLVRAVVADVRAGVSVATSGGRFHAGVAEAFAAAAIRTARAHGVPVVALSGGVFQNHTILTTVEARLAGAGLRVLTHAEVPANDGGLSLGQAFAGILRGTARA